MRLCFILSILIHVHVQSRYNKRFDTLSQRTIAPFLSLIKHKSEAVHNNHNFDAIYRTDQTFHFSFYFFFVAYYSCQSELQAIALQYDLSFYDGGVISDIGLSTVFWRRGRYRI